MQICCKICAKNSTIIGSLSRSAWGCCDLEEIYWERSRVWFFSWPKCRIWSGPDSGSRQGRCPVLNEVIALIRAEESRRGIMLEPVTPEGSAMVAQENTNRNKTKETSKGDPRDNLWCTYYKKSRHTKDRCWKLHGKPRTSIQKWGQWGDKKIQQQSHQVSTTKSTPQNSVPQPPRETTSGHFN